MLHHFKYVELFHLITEMHYDILSIDYGGRSSIYRFFYRDVQKNSVRLLTRSVIFGNAFSYGARLFKLNSILVHYTVCINSVNHIPGLYAVFSTHDYELHIENKYLYRCVYFKFCSCQISLKAHKINNFLVVLGKMS